MNLFKKSHPFSWLLQIRGGWGTMSRKMESPAPTVPYQFLFSMSGSQRWHHRESIEMADRFCHDWFHTWKVNTCSPCQLAHVSVMLSCLMNTQPASALIMAALGRMVLRLRSVMQGFWRRCDKSNGMKRVCWVKRSVFLSGTRDQRRIDGHLPQLFWSSRRKI